MRSRISGVIVLAPGVARQLPLRIVAGMSRAGTMLGQIRYAQGDDGLGRRQQLVRMATKGDVRFGKGRVMPSFSATLQLPRRLDVWFGGTDGHHVEARLMSVRLQFRFQ